MHSNADKTSIKYDENNNLRIHLYYQSLLSPHPFIAFYAKSLDEDSQLDFHEVILKEPPDSNLPIIQYSEYVPNDSMQENDSVCTFQANDCVDLLPSMQPLLWENVDAPCFNQIPACRTQLKNNRHDTDNENNHLLLSRDNTYRFNNNYPTLALRFVEATDQQVEVYNIQMTYCKIAIECFTKEMFECIKHIKPRHECDVNRFEYITNIAVCDPNEFQEFVTFKYHETIALRNYYDDVEDMDGSISSNNSEETDDETIVNLYSSSRDSDE